MSEEEIQNREKDEQLKYVQNKGKITPRLDRNYIKAIISEHDIYKKRNSQEINNKREDQNQNEIDNQYSDLRQISKSEEENEIKEKKQQYINSEKKGEENKIKESEKEADIIVNDTQLSESSKSDENIHNNDNSDNTDSDQEQKNNFQKNSNQRLSDLNCDTSEIIQPKEYLDYIEENSQKNQKGEKFQFHHVAKNEFYFSGIEGEKAVILSHDLQSVQIPLCFLPEDIKIGDFVNLKMEKNPQKSKDHLKTILGIQQYILEKDNLLKY